jgi:hypothetical protein
VKRSSGSPRSALRLKTAIVGHSQAATTHRYAHLDADPLRRAADTIGNKIAAAMAGGKTENVVLLPKKLASAATPVDPDDSQIDCCTLLRLGAPAPGQNLERASCGLRRVMAELPLPLRKRGGSVLHEYWLGFACYLGVRTARRRSAGRVCAKMGSQMADFSCLSTK